MALKVISTVLAVLLMIGGTFGAAFLAKTNSIVNSVFDDGKSDKYETFHQAMLYMGEWVDAASETFEKINSKSDEIYEVSEALSELRKVVPEKFELIDMLEERFEEQQSRLDRLEAKIDELSDMSKMNSNFTVIQKVDKMEMLLSTLNANVEKLTSYVD